jgi:hypothetical protein
LLNLTTRVSVASSAALAGVLILMALPLVSLFLRHVQIFEVGPEFVTYRVGDAFSLLFDDAHAVRPVQGLPNALLSKLIIDVLYFVFGRAVVEPDILQLYSAIFFVVVLGGTAAVIVARWPKMSPAERAGLAVLAVLPWCLEPTASLLPTPEYWIAEYSFLVASLALMPRLLDRPLPAGAWAGLGLAIKINMLGFALLLLLMLPRRNAKVLGLFALGIAAAYLSLLLLYAGLRPGLAFEMLRAQLLFYIHPNHSFTYSGPIAAVRDNAHLVFILGLAVILASLSTRNVAQPVGALLWAGLLFYLIYKRPHLTSMASATLAGLFLIALFGSRLSRYSSPLAAAIPIVAAAILCVTPAFKFYPQMQWTGSPSTLDLTTLDSGDILFMPSNWWNASVPLQAFAYNGQMAIRPARIGSDGRPTADAPAFRAVFGEKLLLGNSIYELSLLQTGLRRRMSVVWTRPPDHDDVAFREALASVGASVNEQQVSHRGSTWFVGRAVVPIDRPGSPGVGD